MIKNKENTNLLKKLVKNTQNLINVSKEHKNVSSTHKQIAKKQLDESMPLKEQRNRSNLQFLFMFLFGIGIGSIVWSLNIFPETTPNYAIDIAVTPNELMLNQKGDIEFEFTFTNVGLKNITDFEILYIEFYRQEGNKQQRYDQLISPFDKKSPYMNCDSRDSENNFVVGEKCKIKTEMYECIPCFDDKDKNIMFNIHLKSNPPLENKIVNLTIY